MSPAARGSRRSGSGSASSRTMRAARRTSTTRSFCTGRARWSRRCRSRPAAGCADPALPRPRCLTERLSGANVVAGEQRGRGANAVGSVPRFVAVALIGAFAALVLAALAAGSERQAAARVTLQVAPRGLGTISLSPAGLDADNQPLSTCSRGEGSDSCTVTYDRGQSVRLTASGGAGRSLSSWSNPDCSGTTPCTLALDDDLTSIVAVFNPLRLGVRLSDPDAGHVTTDPAGKACAQPPDDGGDQCFEFAPGTSVRVTAIANPTHTFRGWNPGCEPTTAPTCTVVVSDEPTWIGARFDADDAPQLPTTITVQFRLKLG